MEASYHISAADNWLGWYKQEKTLDLKFQEKALHNVPLALSTLILLGGMSSCSWGHLLWDHLLSLSWEQSSRNADNSQGVGGTRQLPGTEDGCGVLQAHVPFSIPGHLLNWILFLTSLHCLVTPPRNTTQCAPIPPFLLLNPISLLLWSHTQVCSPSVHVSIHVLEHVR